MKRRAILWSLLLTVALATPGMAQGVTVINQNMQPTLTKNGYRDASGWTVDSAAAGKFLVSPSFGVGDYQMLKVKITYLAKDSNTAHLADTLTFALQTKTDDPSDTGWVNIRVHGPFRDSLPNFLPQASTFLFPLTDSVSTRRSMDLLRWRVRVGANPSADSVGFNSLMGMHYHIYNLLTHGQKGN